jgi:hypothetical protein
MPILHVAYLLPNEIPSESLLYYIVRIVGKESA